ncbi:MAG TPA: BatA domain-containing protein, partial [Gemmatimonadota bacterium]|nr:BatA domain-containing protein [Gemmatimonadota bacterium]
MGFLTPWALLAAPLALVPLILEWRGRRTGEPVRFSSLYLLERARETPRRTLTRSRWVLLLRILTILVLVLAAARPVGPGRGGPGLHRPTRAIVAVDVSASVAQRRKGRPVWEGLRAAADSVLAAATADDRIALAAVADGVVGWWEAEPAALRRRLAGLEPTARASDWPAALAALAARAEDGTESYLFTDGAGGAHPPAPARGAAGAATLPSGHRALWLPAGSAPPNRGLTAAEWTGPATVALAGRAWGPGAPAVAEAGRVRGEELAEPAALPLDGSVSAPAWAVADTATFALTGEDGLPGDDRLFVAAPATGRTAGGEPYRVVRWAPGDEPPEPGPLFWEAALEASDRGVRMERARSLSELAARPPDLALLPLRTYAGAAAATLAALAGAGTRLLFAPACPEPACVPPPGWLP